MINGATISRVYFIGIGGIGMSALARYFMQINVVVSGYDKTPSHLTDELQKEGAAIHFSEDLNQIDKNADLVIYTPAVPADHKELVWYNTNGYTVKKRSQALADITNDGWNICIAGTHGKTTTSTLTACILRESGKGCNAFLGGVSVNYDTNFWGGNYKINVVEADEYDHSFLRLSPDVAAITAVDPDHLDIYGNVGKMREAYLEFAGKLRNDGLLLTKFGLPIHVESFHHHLTYSLQNDSADVCGHDIRMEDGGYHFSITGPGWGMKDLRIEMGGMHNVENSIVAATITRECGVNDDDIRKSLANFRGVKRRFEYIISAKEAKQNKYNVVYIDDYAHHPEELRALLKGARSLFNDKKLTIIFQPHLYTRTRDFCDGFAEVLSMANEVILLPIYPARELPIEGVSSELIENKLSDVRSSIVKREDLLDWLTEKYISSLPGNMAGDVLITAGAGDIDRLVDPIKKKLLNQ